MSFSHDTRIIIYPAYLDSTKTVAEGRRVPKSAACEKPHPVEILDSCKLLKLSAEIEDKSYPRDWLTRGRVRVQLKNSDGAPINPEIATRTQLLLKIASLVPHHPARSKKGTSAAPQKTEAATGNNAAGSSANSKAGGSSKNNKKKKGK